MEAVLVPAQRLVPDQEHRIKTVVGVHPLMKPLEPGMDSVLLFKKDMQEMDGRGGIVRDPDRAAVEIVPPFL